MILGISYESSSNKYTLEIKDGPERANYRSPIINYEHKESFYYKKKQDGKDFLKNYSHSHIFVRDPKLSNYVFPVAFKKNSISIVEFESKVTLPDYLFQE